jgi:hypothetical protein
MRYALVVDGVVTKYPYSFMELRKAHPDVSYPRDPSDERLADWGVVPVLEAERPPYSTTMNYQETTPTMINGVLYQIWMAVPASPDEVASRERQAAEGRDRASVKGDAFVTSFIEMSPAQVISHIDTNVTNLTSAKNVIKKLALMVLLLARQEFK